MTGSGVTLPTRLSARQRAVETELGSVFPEGVPKLTAATRSERQGLWSTWLSMQEGTLSSLRKRVESELEKLINSPRRKFDPLQFGCKSPEELVDVLMSLATDLNMGSLTRRQLLTNTKGLQGNLNGYLLELLVANDPVLQALFRRFAQNQVGYVNQVVADAKGMLTNVKGDLVALKGKLGPAQKVSMTHTLTLVEDRAWSNRLKFVDSAYLSEITPPGGQWVILLTAEIKMPTAFRKGVASQLSKIEQRLVDASVFEFLVEGETSPRTISTESIFFSPLHMKSGVTADTDAIETTMRSVYIERTGEYFLRIGKPVDVDGIMQLTNTLVHP